MKHLLKLTALLIAFTFTFFSCKNASITKRHYNKGYYISHSHKHSKLKANRNAEPAEKLEAMSVAPMLSKNQTEDRELIASATPSKDKVEESAKVQQEVATRGEAKKIKRNAFPYSEQINSIKNKVHIKPIPAGMLQSARDGDALSLIWLLIVVLLIVYLLGILFDGFGLGGLIHILGVVIVVLLILWLLRLI